MFWLLLATFVSFFKGSHCLSACDEVELTFLIDNNFILNELENLKHFLLNIVWDGSSEYDSFSIYLYGNNIPQSLQNNIKLLDSLNTYNVIRRDDQQTNIIRVLDLIYSKLSREATQTVNISLNDAFNIASNAEMPVRIFRKSGFLKYDSVTMGENDGDRVYFVLDYTNEILLSEANDVDTCEIMNYFETSTDEHLHLIMGQPFDRVPIVCNDQMPSFFNHRLIFGWDQIISDRTTMEKILDLTCPAKVSSEEFHGGLNLGSHVQYITDTNLIQECQEVWQNDLKTQLDSTSSFMTVKNYYDDDMTFKEGDYLILDKHTYMSVMVGSTSGLNGCTQAIYRIDHIVDGESHSFNSDYEILNLYVSLPQSPMEYILDCDIFQNDMPINNETDVDMSSSDDDEDNDGNRRRMADFIVLKYTTDDYQIPSFPLDLGWDDTWERSASVSTDVSFVTFTGEGTITIDYGVHLAVDMLLDFEFRWSVLDGDFKFSYKVHGFYEVNAYFIVTLAGTLQVDFNLFEWAPASAVIFIGPVPLVIKPFVTLTVSVITVPLEVYGGLNCTYREAYESGYHYEKEVTFDAEYGLIDEDKRYTLSSKKTWYEDDGVDSLELCVRVNYEYGTGAGLICVWFEWNEADKRCVCRGADAMVGDTTGQSGTNIYIMNKGCGNTYGGCAGCGTEIWVKRDCTHCCGLFDAFDDWTCIKCPLFQSNSGRSVTVYDEYSISNNVVEKKECLKIFGIGDKDPESKNCLNQEFGFDVVIEAKVGVVLYELIQVYIRAALTFPFRMQLPQLNASFCDFERNLTMCDENVYVSFTVSGSLDVYLGVEVTIDQLADTIDSLLDNSDTSDFEISFSAPEIDILTDVEILEETRLGECLKLEDELFEPLNKFLVNKCCPSSGSNNNGDEGETAGDKFAEGNFFADGETTAASIGIFTVIIIGVVGIGVAIWYFACRQAMGRKNGKKKKVRKGIKDKVAFYNTNTAKVKSDSVTKGNKKNKKKSSKKKKKNNKSKTKKKK